MPGNDAPRGPALVAAILGSAGRSIADQPGRHVWGSLRRMRLPGLGQALGRRLAIFRNRHCSLVASAFATPSPAPGWKCRSSMSGCGRCRGWCAMRLVRSLAPSLRRAGRHRRSPAFPRHRSWRPAHGTARRRGQPRLVPDRRGRRRPLHPGDAGGGADPQARQRAWHRGAMPCLGLLTLAEIEASGDRPACGSPPAGARAASFGHRSIGACSDAPTTANRVPARGCTMPVRRIGRGAALSRARETLVGRLACLAVPAAGRQPTMRPSPSSSPLPAPVSSGRGASVAGSCARGSSLACANPRAGSSSASASSISTSKCSVGDERLDSRFAACAAAACLCRARCGQ